MDPISYAKAAKQDRRIKKFIANPDSTSGIVTFPKVIASGETITIPSGRQAILADTVVDGDLVIEAGADVFVPAGAGFSNLDQRIDRLETLQIGAILNGYTIFDNCIVAFGGEFNRADYPKLCAYLQSNPTLVKTETDWQAEVTANGGICGFFSNGNGTTTFRVPNLDKAFLRPDSREIGTYQGDMLKSHSHKAYYYNVSNYAMNNYFTNKIGYSPAYTSTPLELAMDGSGGGVETRPKNIAVLPLIVAK